MFSHSISLVSNKMRHEDNDGGILNKSMAMVTLTMVVIIEIVATTTMTITTILSWINSG